MGDYEVVERIVKAMRIRHDIQGYTIGEHTFRHIVGAFMEATQCDYEDAVKRVANILHEMGYNVA